KVLIGVVVTLQRDRRVFRPAGVDAETRLEEIRRVLRMIAVPVVGPFGLKVFRIDPVGRVRSQTPAVAERTEKRILRARSRGSEVTLGLESRLGEDLDEAVDGEGAPEGPDGTAHDFDAIDVVEQG